MTDEDWAELSSRQDEEIEQLRAKVLELEEKLQKRDWCHQCGHVTSIYCSKCGWRRI